jgi:hypothetical protein
VDVCGWARGRTRPPLDANIRGALFPDVPTVTKPDTGIQYLFEGKGCGTRCHRTQARSYRVRGRSFGVKMSAKLRVYAALYCSRDKGAPPGQMVGRLSIVGSSLTSAHRITPSLSDVCQRAEQLTTNASESF